MAKTRSTNKQRHHIDRRAGQIAVDLENSSDAADRLFTTKQLAGLLAVSEAWVEILRHKGLGPPSIKLGPRCIRYRRSDVLAWLKARASSKEVA
jgi:predicted DNA-binding transcriptional regulator AlpA